MSVEPKDLTYTKENREVICRILNVDVDAFDNHVRDDILEAYLPYYEAKIANISTPRIRDARKKTNAIYQHAKGLRAALASVVVDIPDLPRIEPEGFTNKEMQKSCGSRSFSRDEFDKTLVVISKWAFTLLNNEDKLREFYRMRPRLRNNPTLETEILWPRLFSVYEKYKGSLGYSEDGPLEQFIRAIHHIAGLRSFSTSSLEGVVMLWKVISKRRTAL